MDASSSRTIKLFRMSRRWEDRSIAYTVLNAVAASYTHDTLRKHPSWIISHLRGYNLENLNSMREPAQPTDNEAKWGWQKPMVGTEDKLLKEDSSGRYQILFKFGLNTSINYGQDKSPQVQLALPL